MRTSISRWVKTDITITEEFLSVFFFSFPLYLVDSDIERTNPGFILTCSYARVLPNSREKKVISVLFFF